jgi:hypothetical protein
MSTSISPWAEKLSLQDLYPLAGEERDSDQRTIGVGLELTAAEETGLRLRTMGG